MKTDNINTIVLPEDILAKYLKTNPDTYMAFLDGAIWQLGKDKAIIDKLKEHLNRLIDRIEENELSTSFPFAYRKAKEYLKEIESDNS